MGRPEPSVMFSQTFVHNQLDEYVDEVIFAEPIVITACEFLEQNASSASPSVALTGATSPPSFALEVFVHSEGETRFRRLCQPFLYSHSSSNVLEVEAVVTNLLVVRGSYQSLSLVIYGNTAEDLGQFNIEVDLDSTLTKAVSFVEESLEDLPSALQRTDKFICPLKTLSLDLVSPDISVEIKHILHLTFKVLELPNLGDAIETVVSSVISAASNHATHILRYLIIRTKKDAERISEKSNGNNCELAEMSKELMYIYNSIEHDSVNPTQESPEGNSFSEFEAEPISSKQLMETFSGYFKIDNDSGISGHPQLSQKKNSLLWASLALFLCSGKESCFHFVNGGGMKQLEFLFSRRIHDSGVVTLMLLGVAEQATRNSIGCEGFLGWWPRDDENVPSGYSEGYNQLLKLLLQKQRHDVASLSTFILQRLSCYEVASRYEYAVLSVLGVLSSGGKAPTATLDNLSSAKLQLKNLLKLIGRHGPIEDPSPAARASQSLLLVEADNILSYKATSALVTPLNSCSSKQDIDPYLLVLLKERGFLPLSAALLASPIMHSNMGKTMELSLDITAYIEAIVLSLLYCRSGLLFLLHDPELASTVILALRGSASKKENSVPLCYASFLISKGFYCPPHEVGVIVETHLRIVNAIDCLIASKPQSEELLWSLWELCCLSRSNCGRMALLAVGHFPEAVAVLLAALHSVKELDTLPLTTGSSPLNLAIFHSAVEIFEVIVTDSSASSLGCWIEHAKELHRALHSSSPGSSRKDAPTRLLEWVDASVVYHRTGASGLLRYAAQLASGGDAQLSPSNLLASDAMDVDTVGDISSSFDGNLIDNLLGKSINEGRFLGVTLRDSSVSQLTTTFRILALISENSAVATALYDECAITVIHAILIDCTLMLERSSNSYDYLVDESTDGNSTADLLLERNREQCLTDLLIPCLVLLINLLKRLQEAKEQHRNTKLLKALLQLHREVSPKLAACSTELFCPYPDAALGFKAVCHLLASSLACWPLYGWTPGLFHFLLDSLHATSMLALGPKEACSLLFLLTDLLPEEGVWLWKNGMPILSTLRTLAIGTLLGPPKEQEINWYLQAGNPEKLLSQLTPALLDKIAEIILHYATSTSVVIQDMLRVFIVRTACLSANSASILLQPMILWIRGQLSDLSSLSDMDAWKVYKLLNFIAILLEHPHTKPLMLTDGAQMLSQVLEICISVTSSDADHHLDSKNFEFQLSWCIPVFRSISLISNSTTPVQNPSMYNRYKLKSLKAEDCSRLLSYCLKLCKALPVGRELLACLSAFKAISSSAEGRSALQSIYWRIQAGNQEPDSESKHDTDVNDNSCNASEWKKHPPLLCCLLTLLRSISLENVTQVYVTEALDALSLGALHFALDGKSLNMDNVAAVKFLFGLPPDVNGTDIFSGDNIKYVKELTSLLDAKINSYEYLVASDKNTTLYQVKESAESLLLLLQMSTESDQGNDIISRACSLLSLDVTDSSRIHKIKNRGDERVENYNISGFGDMFLWECPENIRDRMSQTALSAKRKMSTVDGVSRRPRDHSPAETMAQSSYSRGSVPAAPSGPSRRDTFRQRKPNTSRPPSMHVDDYVARERNVDGTTSSNVITVPRVGPTSGRPPSIHVDEFMARQRERQHPVGMAVNEPITQVKAAHAEKEADADKVDKSKQLKPDLDDDIDIVFEGVESDPDEQIFPQPDDNLQQPAPVIIEQNSPHSVVAETESDVNDGSQFSHLSTPVSSNFDENTWNEFSSRMAVSHQDMSLTREASISTDKKYFVPSEDVKNVTATTSSGFASMYGRNSRPSVQPGDSRMPHPNYYSKNTPQGGSNPEGYYDHKFQSNQPPLPPMPPPPTISPVQSQNTESVQSQPAQFFNSMSDVQPPLPPGFHVRADHSATPSNFDSKYARVSRSSPGGSSRQQPPLPPTPPPYSVNTSNLQSFKPSNPQPLYNQNSVGSTDFSHMSILPSSDTRLNSVSASGPTISSYPPLQPLIFSRPAYGSSSTSHQGDNTSSIQQNYSIALSTISSIQPLTQLQPLQPPQLPRPPQPPQHLRPPIHSSSQSEQSFPLLQNSGQLQQLQMLQPPQVSTHVYLPAIQQDNIQHTLQQRIQLAQPQVQHQPGHGTQQTSDDIGMSLQHYFSSPEAIQSLLSDRDKLCQLLEQHPKLMQLLQEKLGHL